MDGEFLLVFLSFFWFLHHCRPLCLSLLKKSQLSSLYKNLRCFIFSGYTTCITCMCNECHCYSVSDMVFTLVLMPGDLNNDDESQNPRMTSELHTMCFTTYLTHGGHVFPLISARYTLWTFQAMCNKENKEWNWMLVQCALQWCFYGETRGWKSGSQNIAWAMVRISCDVPRLTRLWANNDILVSPHCY